MTTKSDVWEFYKKTSSEFAQCNFCEKIYKTSGNTSNLRDHLKRVHNFHKGETVENINLKNKKVSDQDIQVLLKKANANLYECKSDKKKRLDDLIVKMVVKELQPFSVVTDKGFINLIEELDPRYKLPSKATLRQKLLPEVFEECSKKLSRILLKVEHVSFTTDLWTSVNNEGYITITCHFILDNCFKSAVLETVQLQNAHISENIKSHLQLAINKWSLEDKVFTIVTDNAQNMVNACNLLKIRHLPCFAHTLNLCVNDAISKRNGKNDSVIHILTKCRDIVTHFKKSTSAMEKLIAKQRENKKAPLKILQDVSTRWNSTLTMIERILVLTTDDVLTIALAKLPNGPGIITYDKIATLNELVAILKPFETATKKKILEKIILQFQR